MWSTGFALIMDPRRPEDPSFFEIVFGIMIVIGIVGGLIIMATGTNLYY